MVTSLTNLGLTSFFSQQVTTEEIDQNLLARITEVQRTHVIASDGNNEWAITPGGTWYRLAAEQRPTVGDWVVLDDAHEKIERLLDRKSVLTRIAAGSASDIQLLAANVDTLFIVTSCNEDFNEARLERYLALALEAGVFPVIVLTKIDLAEDAGAYQKRAQSLRADLQVVMVNSKDPATLAHLLPWTTGGSTIALAGSSGVGKSTILNSLSGSHRMETGAIREQDAKGRHTTSFRSLHQLPGGGVLLDLPGMRELKVSQLDQALTSAFEDIDLLVGECKYNDCAHDNEPGCAIQQAIVEGQLDKRRLASYRKLLAEESRNSATLAEKRQRDRQFGKKVKQHMALKRQSGKRK